MMTCWLVVSSTVALEDSLLALAGWLDEAVHLNCDCFCAAAVAADAPAPAPAGWMKGHLRFLHKAPNLQC